jgi:carbonic anhydrase
MKKIVTFSAMALSTLLLTYTIQANENHTIKNNAQSKHEIDSEHWGYMGDIGPRHWNEVKKEFKMCSEGKQQSPINIIASQDTNLKALNLDYKTGAESIINNGHTIQINIKEGSVFKIDGTDYKLKQFHFHVPSENNINGKAYPLEAHFVHATDNGKIAVIAVMFADGEANPILAKAWKKLPSLKVDETTKCTLTTDEVQSLMPKNKDYYKFMGSLTTPPCSENVKWYVFKNAMTASKEQINAFFTLFSFPNNRPVQATNNRNIEG